MKVAVINTSASGDSTIITGGAKPTRIMGIYIYSAGTTNITFKRTSTAISGPMPMTTAFPMELGPLPNGDAYFTMRASTNFVINNSAAVQIGGFVLYEEGSG